MKPEPINIRDPVKRTIMASISKMANKEIEGYPGLCADLEVGIKGLLNSQKNKAVDISQHNGCSTCGYIIANQLEKEL